MPSMRTLNRRLQRWHRYAAKTYWNPRVTSPRWLLPRSAVMCPPGHIRAWHACWQGCDDLHTCPDCGDFGCVGDCAERFGPEPDDDAGHGDDLAANRKDHP